MQEKNSEWEKRRVSVSVRRRPLGPAHIHPPSSVAQESSETPNDCSGNLEDALIRLEEEQQRYDSSVHQGETVSSAAASLASSSPGAAACRRSTPC